MSFGAGRLARVALGAALALGAVALALFIGARGGGDAEPALAQASEAERAAGERQRGGRSELPRGGRSVLPQYRPIGFYGAPQSPELGELGIGSPESAAKRLRKQIKP